MVETTTESFAFPVTTKAVLSTVLKQGAQRMLATAIEAEGEREKFTSSIFPHYLRKAKKVEEIVPWLYLKGISTGGMNEALQSLLGPDCPGLSATTVTRLKAAASYSPAVLQGIPFKDGIQVTQAAA